MVLKNEMKNSFFMFYSYREPFVRKCLSKLEDLSSQTLIPLIKDFSRDGLPTQCERSREMFLTEPGTNPFKTNQKHKTLNSNFRVKVAP